MRLNFLVLWEFSLSRTKYKIIRKKIKNILKRYTYSKNA